MLDEIRFSSVFGVKPPSSRRSSINLLNVDHQASRQIQVAEDAGDYDLALKLRYLVLENVAAQKRRAEEQYQTFGGVQQGQNLNNCCEVLLNHGEEYIRRLNFYALMLINQRNFKEASKLLAHAASFVASDPSNRPINIFNESSGNNTVLHRCAATIENNMGLCAFKANRLHDAEIHFFACASMEEQLGEEADNPARTLFNLAQVQYTLRKHKSAAECAAAAAEHLSDKLNDERLLLVQQEEVRQLLFQALLLKASAEKELRSFAKALGTYQEALAVARGDHSPVDGESMVRYIESLLKQCQALAKREKTNPTQRKPSRPTSAAPERAASISSAYGAQVRGALSRPNSAAASSQRAKSAAPKPVNEQLAPYYRREKVVTSLVPNNGLLRHSALDFCGVPPMSLDAISEHNSHSKGQNDSWKSLPPLTTKLMESTVVSQSESGTNAGGEEGRVNATPIPQSCNVLPQRPTSVSFVSNSARTMGDVAVANGSIRSAADGQPIKVPTRPTTAPKGRPPSASSSRSNIPGVPQLRDSPIAEPLNYVSPTTEPIAVQQPPASIGANTEMAMSSMVSWGEDFEALPPQPNESAPKDELSTEDLLIAAALKLTTPRSHNGDVNSHNAPLSTVFGQNPGLRDIYGQLALEHRKAFDSLAAKPPSKFVTVPSPMTYMTVNRAEAPTSPLMASINSRNQSIATQEVMNRSPTRYFPWAPPNAQPVRTLRRHPLTRNENYNNVSPIKRPPPHQTSPTTAPLKSTTGRESTGVKQSRSGENGSATVGSPTKLRSSVPNTLIMYGAPNPDDLLSRAAEITAREVGAEIIQAAGRAFRDRRRMGQRKRMADEIRVKLREEVRGVEQAIAESRALGIIRDHDRQLEARRQALGSELAAEEAQNRKKRVATSESGPSILNEDIMGLFQASVVNIPVNNNTTIPAANEIDAENESSELMTKVAPENALNLSPSSTDAVGKLIHRQREQARKLQQFNEEQHEELQQEQLQRKQLLTTLCAVQGYLRAKTSVAVATNLHSQMRRQILSEYADRQLKKHAMETLIKYEPVVAERRREKKERRARALEAQEAAKVHRSIVVAFVEAALSERIVQSLRIRLAEQASTIVAAFLMAKDSENLVQSAKVDQLILDFRQKTAAAVTIQKIMKGFLARKHHRGILATFLEDMYANKAHFAASKIQATFRMHYYGKPLKPAIAADSARRYQLAEAEARRLRLRAVAPIIQRAYRSYLSRRAAAFLRGVHLERRKEYLSNAMRDYAARMILRFSRIVAAKVILRRQREVMTDILKFRERQRNRLILEHSERSVLRIATLLLQRVARGHLARRSLRYKRIMAVANYDKMLLETSGMV